MSVELRSGEWQGERFLLEARDAKMFELAPYILGVCERGEPGVIIVESRLLNGTMSYIACLSLG